MRSRLSGLSFIWAESEKMVEHKTFYKNVIWIGKLDSSDLCLHDEEVSRIHAVIEVKWNHDVHIIDLGSPYGTLVNGQKAIRTPIRTGDTIRIGRTDIVVEIGNLPKRRLYLANPYGFSRQQRERLLPEIVLELEKLGANVVEPFTEAGNVRNDDPNWAFALAHENLEYVKSCDGILAVVNGCPPDEGVMVELGFAMALRKKIFLFRDDFRRCSDSEIYPLNLMLFASLPWPTWRKHWFESVDDLVSDDKALKAWLSVL